MMWLLLLLLCTAQPEPVASEDDIKLILQGDKSCEGYIEILYDGKWGVVGDTDWTLLNEEVVCRSVGCGSSRNASVDVPKPNATVWLNEVSCNGSEKNLWECRGCPGWNISRYHKSTVKKIKCRENITVTLGGIFPCRGAVQFNKTGKTGYVCRDNWGQSETNRLCENLKCGASGKISDFDLWTLKNFDRYNKLMFKCSGREKHLWQCAPKESTCRKPFFVTCSDHQKLQLTRKSDNVCSGQLLQMKAGETWKPFISQNNNTYPHHWCKEMYCGSSGVAKVVKDKVQLACSDKVNITLKNNHCYGTVYTRVNNMMWPVCSSNTWSKKTAEVVCNELKCGKAIEWSFRGSSSETQSIIDHVSCSGGEASMWYCDAKHDNDAFQCSSFAYVVCANSLQVRLSDGPGRCAGRMEIQHEGEWKRVRNSGWTTDSSNKVCSFLGDCGNTARSTSPDEFTKGSGPFLHMKVDCKSNSENISDCVSSELANQPQRGLANQGGETVGIICENHKVVFLSSSCSGKVGIEHGEKDYWLSGSNETWNKNVADAVCRQMHCGEAKDFNKTHADKKNEVLKEFYDCSSDSKSLFDCNKTGRTPVNYNDTVATVICKGNITVKLTNGCKGLVQVCVDGHCEGVCADAWTESKSVMLCKTLKCGDKSLKIEGRNQEKGETSIKSLHLTKMTTKMTECNMVKNDKSYCEGARVLCSGSVTPRFQVSRECSGNVELFYENKWRPVCSDALADKKTQDTICRELKCGQANKVLEYFGPQPQARPLQLNCADDNKSLAACDISSASSSCTPAVLQCEKWKKMELKMETSPCAGAVIVKSEGKESPVSSEGWTDEVGEKICQNLNCGDFLTKEEKNYTKMPFSSKRSISFKCASKEKPVSIWDCEDKEMNLSRPNKLLHVNCKDEASVTLSNNCYGQVKIGGIAVCDTKWDPKTYSDMVCQEKSCSNAILGTSMDKQADKQSEVFNVHCESHNYKLGQCKRFKEPCQGKLVSVYCTKSVNFSTTGKCGGQIQVSYGDKWEPVCPLTEFTDHFKNELCDYLECGKYKHSNTLEDNAKPVDLGITLKCSERHMDIRHCVIPKGCGKSKPAEIYCQNYEPPRPPPEPHKDHTLAISLGGLCLIIVIIFFVLLRICIIKFGKNITLRSSTRRVEFESGEYEDIGSNANEMKDFSHAEIMPEVALITEKDAQSTSSLPYDDIDKEDEILVQPLTSGMDSSPASDAEVDYINETAGAQSEDVVTYEVEDPKYDYDDIAATCEILQTEAEIHNSPQTDPGNNAEAPAGPMQEEGDYLVPDQDGRRVKWE